MNTGKNLIICLLVYVAVVSSYTYKGKVSKCLTDCFDYNNTATFFNYDKNKVWKYCTKKCKFNKK